MIRMIKTAITNVNNLAYGDIKLENEVKKATIVNKAIAKDIKKVHRKICFNKY